MNLYEHHLSFFFFRNSLKSFGRNRKRHIYYHYTMLTSLALSFSLSTRWLALLMLPLDQSERWKVRILCIYLILMKRTHVKNQFQNWSSFIIFIRFTRFPSSLSPYLFPTLLSSFIHFTSFLSPLSTFIHFTSFFSPLSIPYISNLIILKLSLDVMCYLPLFFLPFFMYIFFYAFVSIFLLCNSSSWFPWSFCLSRI